MFTDRARRRGLIDQLRIDSCGTGAWHAGEGADPRSVQVAGKYGLDTTHVARQVQVPDDFDNFDLLLAMDRSNRDNLIRLGAPRERVSLMRSFDPTLTDEPDERALDVPDPYYGGPHGFELMYEMLERACDGLLDHLVIAGRLRA